MKIIFLLISICLIGLVLYLGYQLDKKEEQNNRKKKYNYDRETQNSKNTFQSLKKGIQEKVDSAKEKREEKRALMTEKRIQKLNEQREKEYRDEEKYEEDASWECVDEEFLVERNLKDLRDDIVEDVIIPKEKNINEETMPINTVRNKNNEKNSQDTVVIDTIKNNRADSNKVLEIDEKDFEVIQKKMLDKIINNDFDEEDELLLDIEREIEHANIKKYTRVKNATKAKKKSKPKKTTSKKSSEEKKEEVVKPKETKKTTKKSETKKDTKKSETDSIKENKINVKKFTRIKKDLDSKSKKKSK